MSKKTVYVDQLAIKRINTAWKEFIQKVTPLIQELRQMGLQPTLQTLADFQRGGSKLHEKLSANQRLDRKMFKSPSGGSLLTESQESELRDLDRLQVQLRDLRTGLFQESLDIDQLEFNASGELEMPESLKRQIIDVNSIRITEGSSRFRAFQLAQTAIESINELDQLCTQAGISPHSGARLLQAFDTEGAAPGLISYNDFLPQPAFIEPQHLAVLPDEPLEESK